MNGEPVPPEVEQLRLEALEVAFAAHDRGLDYKDITSVFFTVAFCVAVQYIGEDEAANALQRHVDFVRDKTAALKKDAH